MENLAGLLYLVCLCFLCVQCFELCCYSKNTSEIDHNYLLKNDKFDNSPLNDEHIFMF